MTTEEAKLPQLEGGGGDDVAEKYLLRPPFEQKFKPTAVKPLIHEVHSKSTTYYNELFVPYSFVPVIKSVI